jgi:hypothetical protein
MAQRDVDAQIIKDVGAGNGISFLERFELDGANLTPAQVGVARTAAAQGPAAFEAYVRNRSVADSDFWDLCLASGTIGARILDRWRVMYLPPV